MADISKIKLPNGSEYDIKDKTSGYITSSDIPQEVFIATYGTTTYAEITAAYTAGKLIVCKNGYDYVPLTMQQSNYYYFHYPQNYGTAWYRVSSSNSWGSNTYNFVSTTTTVNGKALSSSITLTASNVGALPDSTTIPTKTSDLTNDSGFLTLATLPIYDGTVE